MKISRKNPNLNTLSTKNKKIVKDLSPGEIEKNGSYAALNISESNFKYTKIASEDMHGTDKKDFEDIQSINKNKFHKRFRKCLKPPKL